MKKKTLSLFLALVLSLSLLSACGGKKSATIKGGASPCRPDAAAETNRAISPATTRSPALPSSPATASLPTISPAIPASSMTA